MLSQVLILAWLHANPTQAATPELALVTDQKRPKVARAKPKSAPRVAPKTRSKPTPKASPKPSPKPAPRASPKPAPKPAPRASPKPAPRASPKPAPRAAPKPAPRAAPKPAPRAAPKPAPRAAPKTSPSPRPTTAQPRTSAPSGARAPSDGRPRTSATQSPTRPTATHNPNRTVPQARALGEGRPKPASARQPESLRPSLGQRPTGGTRNFEKHLRSSPRTAPHRSSDHRFARPNPAHVARHPRAHHGRPAHYYYRPYYSRWYVHPWWRWCYSTTVVVGFGFSTYAWFDWWAPPYRAGWIWMPGYWQWGYWHPGFWRPAAPAPTHYVYVSGWWESETVYVEGYYRTEERNEWEWIEGYYLEDGLYIRGQWVPTEPGEEGYVWESGFWDGETWIDGFWRPEYRSDFTWISAYYDEDGVFHSGYWMPLDEREGHAWIPGWFDGNGWEEGYWVSDDDIQSEDVGAWEPAEGWDDGWEVGGGWGDGEVLRNDSPGGPQDEGMASGEDRPLALPVDIPE